MEHFAVDDLVISLMAKRKECMHSLYKACLDKIDELLEKDPSLSAITLSEYFAAIERENARIKEEAERIKERKKEQNRKRKLSKERNKELKRRKSMIVTIDDVSFSFGKDQLEQITGQEKQVDPEVKNILQKMNDLFKQLGKNPPI